MKPIAIVRVIAIVFIIIIIGRYVVVAQQITNKEIAEMREGTKAATK
jgi:hypothetical protein